LTGLSAEPRSTPEPAALSQTIAAVTAEGPREEAGSGRSAWRLLAFLILLNIINFVDRQLITSLQIPLREDATLRLTDVQNQLLAGYAFSVVYSCAGLMLGSLADRRHRPRLVAMGLLVWSAMTAASGLAQNFTQLGLARIFVAIGEATLTPAAVAMIGDVFRPRQRALASGLYYLGIPLGASFSLIVANLLWPIPWIGWRGCFIALGLVGLSMVVALLFVKDPPRGQHDGPVHHGPAVPPTGLALVKDFLATFRRSPALGLTMLGAILINIGVGATWLDASWLNAERGFSKQGAPIFLGVCLLIGGSAGNFLGGWLGDRLQRGRRGGRLWALVLIQASIIPFAVAFRFLPGAPAFRPALAICCVISTMMITYLYGPVLATVQELTPPRLRATMVAFLLIGLNILGASLGSVMAASLAGRLRSYTWGIFITSQASLMAIPVFLLALRCYRAQATRPDVLPGGTTT
jgi:MFS family permease